MAEWKDLFGGRLLIVVGFFFVFVLALSFIFGDRGILDNARSAKRLEALQQEIVKLEKQRDTLKGEVDHLRNQPNAVEATAREKLWLIKKNEKLVIFASDIKGVTP
jgi:cell division protein FtsB